jgi:hypothetical protein
MRWFLVGSALLSLAPLHTALCQDITSLRAGELVRINITPPTSGRVEGRLVSLSADTIVVSAPTTALAIGIPDVRMLEVKRRSGGSFARSVVFGVLGGVVGGAVILGATGSTDTGDGTITAGDKVLIGSVVGGIAGFIGGTIFGACCSATWQPVRLPRRT